MPVTSRHVRHSSELLLRAPVRQGFVPMARTTSYATRLRLLLRTLSVARKVGAERDFDYGTGPIARLRTLFSSQWAVTADDQHLLMTVTFDRSWEEYFEILVRCAGPSLDLIFQHCEGYEQHECVGPGGLPQYQAFTDWVRRHQVRTDFFYPTVPDVTVDDVASLRRIAMQPEPTMATAAGVAMVSPRDDQVRYQFEAAFKKTGDVEAARNAVREERREIAVRALGMLRRLDRYFPEWRPETGARPFAFAVQNLVEDIHDLRAALPAASRLGAWLERVCEPRLPAPARPTANVRLEPATLDDIQGNILTSYRGMTHGVSVLLRFASRAAGKRVLGQLAERVTSEAATLAPGAVRTNVALTFPGLRRLGLPPAVLAQFPVEFQQGMEARNGAIGDLGDAHPTNWTRPRANWPNPDAPGEHRVALSAVDAVVTLQVQSDAAHAWNADHPLFVATSNLENHGAQILHVQQLQRPPGADREHFGFKDGIGQPAPLATLVKAAGELDLTAGQPVRDHVPLGEFLLGYPDARGEKKRCADPAHNRHASLPLFQNGTFLVVRKLAQDVEAFEAWASAQAEPGQQEALKNQIVGRARDGRAVHRATLGNDFDYDGEHAALTPGESPQPPRCPLHAHIRMANPRQENAISGPVPRILRRAFSYGPRHSERPTAERGLFFMACNASIAQQYEVVQRWLNGGNVTGLRATQNDLLTGTPLRERGPYWVRGAAGQWRSVRAPERPFTWLLWGLYAFVPSRSALRWLAAQPLTASPQGPSAEAGERVIEALQAVRRERGPEASRQAWRAVIEDFQKRPEAAALWAAVRKRGKLKTDYGWLIGNRELARQVLADTGRRFSVREYWHRLMDAAGEHYIALDPEPGRLTVDDSAEQAKHERYEARLQQVRYADTAAVSNAALLELFGPASTTQVAEHARTLGEAVLDRAGTRIGAGQLARRVVAQLAQAWFGISKTQLRGIVLASRYAFQPHPDQPEGYWATHLRPFEGKPSHDCLLASQLCEARLSDSDLNGVLVGSAVGFAAPAIASIATVLVAWQRNGDLQAVAEGWCKSGAGVSVEQRWQALFHRTAATLAIAPVPSFLYRTAMNEAVVDGQSIEPGERVIVGLGGAALDREGDADPATMRDWLFGGAQRVDGSGDNPHACPARHGAIASIAGAVAAVLDRQSLTGVGGALLAYGPSRADRPAP